MIGHNDLEVERKIISILKIINESSQPVGARLIARQLKGHGVELGERAVRYHIKLMDERVSEQVFIPLLVGGLRSPGDMRRMLAAGADNISINTAAVKNPELIRLGAITQGKSLGVDLLTFPELAICGYPPEDLLLKPQFIEENLRALEKVKEHSSGLTVVVGFVDAKGDIYNAVAVIHDGELVGIYHKIYLPNYGVFDENRYFQAGREYPVYVIASVGRYQHL